MSPDVAAALRALANLGGHAFVDDDGSINVEVPPMTQQRTLLDLGEPTGPATGIKAGWRRIDPRPWSKCRARWIHKDGWKLDHCGHPTANHPWALYEPSGRMVLTGATLGNPHHGTAWDRLDEAMAFVAEVIAGTRTYAWPDQASSTVTVEGDAVGLSTATSSPSGSSLSARTTR